MLERGERSILVLSHCWMTAAHPDPSGKQLAKVAATLKGEMPKYKKPSDSFHGFAEMGVFWDWASLSQKARFRRQCPCGRNINMPRSRRHSSSRMNVSLMASA